MVGLHHISRYHIHTRKSRIRAIIMHSSFNKITYENDIALFKLMESMKFNEYIQPICIPDVPVALNDEMPCFITGWGQTTEKGEFLFSPFHWSIKNEKVGLKPECSFLVVDGNYPGMIRHS